MGPLAYAIVALGIMSLTGWVVWYTDDLRGLLVLLLLLFIGYSEHRKKD